MQHPKENAQRRPSRLLRRRRLCQSRWRTPLLQRRTWSLHAGDRPEQETQPPAAAKEAGLAAQAMEESHVVLSARASNQEEAGRQAKRKLEALEEAHQAARRRLEGRAAG